MLKFKRLTRGLKLLYSHVFTPIADTLSLLTATGVTADDYDKEYGTFRINLNIPYVNAGAKANDSDRYSTITVPFVLPTYQELFESDNSEIDDYELIEVSVSQDTRCEAARLLGIKQDNTVNEEGSIIQGEGNAFTVYLMEKELDNSATSDGTLADKEVYKISIPEVAILDPRNRANPFVQTNIAIPLRHDRSYLVEFVPEKYNQPFFSVTISLKIKRKLTARDSGATIQNMPAHQGVFNNTAQAPNTPAGNSVISADSSTGVHTNFALIDGVIDRGLRGGYSLAGRRNYDENLKSDAAYEVIAVPMYASWFANEVTPSGAGIAGAEEIWAAPGDLPFSNPSSGGLKTMDRAIIPLRYPMTIHHVFVCVNYTHAQRGTAGARPSQATFTNEVGVGLLQGIRAEDYAVQQVANVSWVPGAASLGTKLIDRIASGSTSASSYTYLWDIVSCPLVGAGGKGYINQGHPVFAGKGSTGTNIRSNIAGAGPVTQGGEQALDIRWKISDIGDPATVNGTIVGWPGHWLYIVGKKHLI